MPKWLFAILLTGLILFQLHNAWLYPITKGFDARAHIEYIQLLQTERRLPLANEGWQLYQPPLYYLIAAVLPSLKLVQLVNVSYYLLLLIISFAFLDRHFSHFQAQLGTLLIGVTPLTLYMTPAIGNEFFSAVIISGMLLAYDRFRLKLNQPSIAVFLGIIAGVALLAKATAWVVIAAIAIDQVWMIFQHWQEKGVISFKTLQSWLIIALVTVMFGGWFYLRNIWYFHNPFIASADFITLSQFDQPIVARTPWFLVNPIPFFALDIYNAGSQSLLVGTYFTWFYDAKHVMAPVVEFSKAGVMMLLLSYPLTIIMVSGVWRMLKHPTPTSQFFLLYTALLVMSYVAYNFKIPLDSTVKACFIGSLLMPFSYFFLLGYQKLGKSIKRLGVLYIMVYAMIIGRHFWIQDWWV